MNAVDATSREEATDSGTPPSLLTLIIDTNPHAWSLLRPTLPLPTFIANILVFINAHLAINHANRIAVIASHTSRAQFLYPTPTIPSNKSQAHAQNQGPNGFPSSANDNDNDTPMEDAPRPPREPDANKYRPFATVENAITSNLLSLLSSTTPADLSATNTTLSGALTLALTYIAKQTLNTPSAINVSSPADATAPAGAFTGASTADGTLGPSTTGLQSRILVVSVSGGLSLQYIPIMNAIFACQRLAVPIDILALNRFSEAEFLEQAADATGGVYVDLGGEKHHHSQDTNTDRDGDANHAAGGGAGIDTKPEKTKTKTAGLLQTLMMAFLPDQSARKHLIPAGESEGVDFRAACFCHGNVVDLGWVCSICLSIFCHPLNDNTCLTCGTYLTLSNYGTKPIVVPKKKVKKKRLGNITGAAGGVMGGGGGGIGSAVASRDHTPGSEGVTPR